MEVPGSAPVHPPQARSRRDRVGMMTGVDIATNWTPPVPPMRGILRQVAVRTNDIRIITIRTTVIVTIPCTDAGRRAPMLVTTRDTIGLIEGDRTGRTVWRGVSVLVTKRRMEAAVLPSP